MKKLILILTLLVFYFFSHAQLRHSPRSRFMSYTGLVMTGYQGWFNAQGDGANRGWNHYGRGGEIGPGNIRIELWPEVAEYTKTYPTSFQYPDGSVARLFSSYDKSTVDLHFKWMRQYHIDGAFVQRFVTSLKNKKSYLHNNQVLQNAVSAALANKRAIALMYDLSGMNVDDDLLVISDFKKLVDSMRLTNGGSTQSYLYHNKKPLVVLWGVGFNDGRKYNLETVARIMDFLKNDPVYGGCSVMLGVPTQWRDLKGDTENNSQLLELCKQADIVQPWFVGRFNEQRIPLMMERIRDDMAWCKLNKVDYVPVIYPGFSWHNMKPSSPFNQIPRNKGSFFWKQLSGAISNEVKMIYIAMFDEVDEGTAIFKASKQPPTGSNEFITFEEGIPTDYYLYLSGMAARILRKEIPFQSNIPVPKSK